MRPLRTLASVDTPDGRRLSLHRRGDDFLLRLDGEELMSSRAPGSEVALAERACSQLPPAKRHRIVIGGLGLGFTLRAALAAVPANAELIVAEVYPEVVEWNRVYLSRLGHPLEDPRVRLHQGAVQDLLLETPRDRYHAVLLDVDHSPSDWSRESNRELYDLQGLARVGRSLVPGGIFGVWSAYPDAAFVKRLRRSGFEVRTEVARARGAKGSHHTLFLARRRSVPLRSTVGA